MNNLLSIQSTQVPIHLTLIGMMALLLFCIMLHKIYRYHQKKYLLQQNPYMLTLLSFTTFAIVSIIQDSLMLSLGMVGALSIVRFRTPVKSSFDLAYIFLAVALGVGFASGKIVLSVIIFCFVFGAFIYVARHKLSKLNSASNLRITCKLNAKESIYELMRNLRCNAIIFDGVNVHIELSLEQQTLKEVMSIIESTNANVINYSIVNE